jgi:hypothetical protein
VLTALIGAGGGGGGGGLLDPPSWKIPNEALSLPFSLWGFEFAGLATGLLLPGLLVHLFLPPPLRPLSLRPQVILPYLFLGARAELRCAHVSKRPMKGQKRPMKEQKRHMKEQKRPLKEQKRPTMKGKETYHSTGYLPLLAYLSLFGCVCVCVCVYVCT